MSVIYDCPCCAQTCIFVPETDCLTLLYCDSGRSFWQVETDYYRDDCTDECPVPPGAQLWVWIVGLCAIALCVCCACVNCCVENARRRRYERIDQQIEEEEQ